VKVGGGFYQVSEDVGSLAGADVVDDLQARSVLSTATASMSPILPLALAASRVSARGTVPPA
jgi:hypothetical protein